MGASGGGGNVISNVSNSVNQSLANYGNNLNYNVNRTFQSAGAFTKGDTKGVENQWMNDAAAPFGVKQTKDNNVDIATKDAQAAQANLTANDLALQQKDAINTKNAMVDSVGKRQLSTPGRAQTLLTAGYGQPSNTLLTLMNGNK